MSAVGPLDAMFLGGESREQPMHVGGLMLFELPEGAGRDQVFPESSRDFVSRLYHELVAAPEVNPQFARRVRNRIQDLGYWSWEQDDAIDLDYHVRLSALPRPGRVRELFELTSRLHGTLLDRHRPLWEMHLIDGVEGRRFAVYSKIHHSMIDGVTALRWMQKTLTTDPTRTGMPATYALPPEPADPQSENGWLPTITRTPTDILKTVVDVAGLPLAGVKGLVQATMPFQAPRTVFNQGVTGARRFAAQSWPIERLEKVRAITGATLNDVLLAMCSGALRNYLLELNALPDKSLTAMVPVSLRDRESTPAGGNPAPGGGNSLGTLIANLATDEADPERRIRRIMASTAHAKSVLSGLTPLQNLIVGALGFGVAGPAAVVPGVAGLTPPPYNLVISNVPGPRESPLYWNRSRLLGMYPASIVLNGQALNISVTSYAHQLHFGLVGCRRTVPHLQRLLGHLEASLADLENL
ncbi:WS/DGAT/MGAT family O-acyltransferase [Kribbella solani]|uniref:WS/DGAT/MGAT family O-acyltransferase n=1 Tax=Kribbella solani TaxID=236067 RepID=UPI0029A0C5AC|nr:wax ester/triacylglycerol synthase family O-acyltransferase [Kribbella solani]MDX2970919.1 wax ester/triacylglycerol synthase family O-acyltransferase [Kribbella solani]